MNSEATKNQVKTETIDSQRRTISKLALWTPPVMMTLMLSKRASAGSVEIIPGPAQSGGTGSSSWGGY